MFAANSNSRWSFVFLLMVLLVWGCGSGDSSDGNAGDEGANPQEDPHVMGSVWAMVYPTIIALNSADHTYLRGLDETETQYDWMCFGIETGGEELENTRTDGDVDLTVVDFMASEEPCKWPFSYYMRVGVCFQCANRGLYFTGKTVEGSAGYTLFVSLYGTYGDESEGDYSMDECLAAAPSWQGGNFRQLSAHALDPESHGMGAQSEIALYDRFYGVDRNSAYATADPQMLWRVYLDELFGLNVRETLGDAFEPSRLLELQRIRNDFLDAKEALEAHLSTQEVAFSEDEAMVQYQDLFNDLIDQYKTILSPDEYEALFNLTYESPLELRSFLP
jgi:hypothetical protein